MQLTFDCPGWGVCEESGKKGGGKDKRVVITQQPKASDISAGHLLQRTPRSYSTKIRGTEKTGRSKRITGDAAVQNQKNNRTKHKKRRCAFRAGFGCKAFSQEGKHVVYRTNRSYHKRQWTRGVNYLIRKYLYRGKSEAILATFFPKVSEPSEIATKLLIIWSESRKITRKFTQTAGSFKTIILIYFVHMLPDIGSWNRFETEGIEEWIDRRSKTGRSAHGLRFTESKDNY